MNGKIVFDFSLADVCVCAYANARISLFIQFNSKHFSFCICVDKVYVDTVSKSLCCIYCDAYFDKHHHHQKTAAATTTTNE